MNQLPPSESSHGEGNFDQQPWNAFAMLGSMDAAFSSPDLALPQLTFPSNPLAETTSQFNDTSHAAIAAFLRTTPRLSKEIYSVLHSRFGLSPAPQCPYINFEEILPTQPNPEILGGPDPSNLFPTQLGGVGPPKTPSWDMNSQVQSFPSRTVARSDPEPSCTASATYASPLLGHHLLESSDTTPPFTFLPWGPPFDETHRFPFSGQITGAPHLDVPPNLQSPLYVIQLFPCKILTSCSPSQRRGGRKPGNNIYGRQGCLRCRSCRQVHAKVEI